MVLKKTTLIFLLLWSGCSHQEKILTNQTTSIPQNTSEKYRAEGRGETEKEAVAMALESIASQLSSTVGSTFNIYKKSSVSEYDKVVTSKINMEVTDLKFNNYQLLNKNIKNGKYFIELEVDREKLAEQYLLKLKRDVSEIENALKERSDFKRYIFFKKYTFDNLYLQLSYMRTILPQSKNILLYEQKIEAFQNQKIKYRKEMSFRVESSNAKAKEIAIDVLNQAHFDVLSNGKIVFNIHLGKVNISKIYQKYYGVATATIKIVNNQEINTKVLKLSSKSLGEKEGVINGILEDLEQKLTLLLEEML